MLNTALELPENEISTSITKNWTPQAVECYRLNGNCAECSIKQAHYSFNCQMPKVVQILKVMNGRRYFRMIFLKIYFRFFPDLLHRQSLCGFLVY